MAHGYVVVDDGRIVVERWVGVIRHADVVAHKRAQLRDDSIAAGAAALVDLREARFPESDSGNIGEIASVHGEAENVTSIGKYAIVTSGSETYHKARVFERESTAFGVTIVVFNALSTACAWLGVPPARAEELIASVVCSTPTEV